MYMCTVMYCRCMYMCTVMYCICMYMYVQEGEGELDRSKEILTFQQACSNIVDSEEQLMEDLRTLIQVHTYSLIYM